MKKFNKLSISVLLASLIGPFGLTGLVIAGEDEQRAPPEARTSGTLSQQVMRAISENSGAHVSRGSGGRA